LFSCFFLLVFDRLVRLRGRAGPRESGREDMEEWMDGWMDGWECSGWKHPELHDAIQIHCYNKMEVG